MDRSNDNFQLAQPQNRFKRSHDATRLSPSIDVLRLDKRRRFDNVEEWQDSVTTTTTGTGGSHAHHRLDVSITGQDTQEELDISTRGSYPQAPVRNALYPQSPHTAVPADVRQTNAFFQNAHGFNINGNPSFQNHSQNIGRVTNIFGGGTDGLQNLNGFVSFDSQFDSSAQDPDRQCHPETRQNVLKRLRDWIDNLNSTERIFWLYGPAGAGKSAIAQTIARSYVRPKVAGTFFFFRSDTNRNDGNRLFTTLAYQLAYAMPEIKDYIAHNLSERPDLPRADVETQFNELFARPFQVLSDDSTQQLAPVIVDIVKKYQELAPVIIIDGIDECMDESLQRRFLKVIGDAVKDDHFPLRFLIVSRPELHIEQTIRRFQTPILTVDLAKLDDANRDIEKYLVDEFSRIASEQDLDPTWPCQEIIDDIVYKSSGNFILPSVIIRFVDDPDNFAETQLDIVRNMKPPTTMTPFAVLDQLFLEILRRVPDQDFLKRYLALLTARIAISSGYGDLYKDDAVLMHVCSKELYAKLRKMRSLLRLEDRIDVHHRSFIDFLHDLSRSSDYSVGKPGGIRRYLEVFVDSLVRYASAVIEKPTPHNTPHFAPRFRMKIADYPLKIELPVKELPEVIQPLLDLQDKLLQLPNLAYARDLLPCDKCTVFYLLRDLPHIGLLLEIFKGQPSNPQSVTNARKRSGVVSSTTTKKKTNYNDLDSLLVSLFSHYPATTKDWSPTKKVIKLVNAILHFDCAETATRVLFVSDAQKLIDLLYYLIHEKNVLGRIHPDAACRATLLALKTFARVPMFPSSIGNYGLYHDAWRYGSMPIEVYAQTIFASKVLDGRYIAPVLGATSCHGDLNVILMKEWRQRYIPSPVAAIQIMLGLAKAIQYFHSLGVILDRGFALGGILLDSGLRPKVRCWCSTSGFLLDQERQGWFSPKENISSFGCIFYELFSGVETKPSISSEERRHIIANRSPMPDMPDCAWQLIQRCCAEDPESRPTMDEVVEEMESWTIE